MQDRVEALHRRVGDSVSWLDSDRGVTNVLPAACIPSPPALLLVTYPEYTAPHRWLIHCVSSLRPLAMVPLVYKHPSTDPPRTVEPRVTTESVTLFNTETYLYRGFRNYPHGGYRGGFPITDSQRPRCTT